MTPITKKITLLLIAMIGLWFSTPTARAQGASVSFQVFYDDLSPYGTWVNNPSYGYVWVPNEGPGFVPYESGGHWVYTEFGWTWVSDYAWGWAPFHYGRWYTDPVYGAMWVPDSEWGPAWVTWRHADGYYGWAPMAPGIGVDVYINGGYEIPADRWCFVHDRDFGREDIHNHYVSRSENNTIISHSTVVNNSVVNHNTNQRYAAGPQNNEVAKVTGRPVNPVAIHDAPKPGKTQVSANEVQVYRPKVEKTTPSGQKPAPPHAVEMKDLKPAAQRNNAAPQKAEPSKQTAPQRTTPANNVKSQPAPNRQPAAQPAKQTPAPLRQAPAANQPQHQTAPARQPAAQPQRPAQPVQRPAQQPAPTRQAPAPQSRPVQQPQQNRPMQQQPPPRQEAPQSRPAQQAPPQQQREAPIRQEQPQQNRPMQEQPREEPQRPH